MPARNTAGVRVRHWKRPIPMATEKKINILSFYKRTDYSEMKHGINHIQRPEFSRKIIPHVYKFRVATDFWKKKVRTFQELFKNISRT